MKNIGRCSFGIYLVHPLVLDQVCRVVPNDDILNANPAGSVLLLAVRFAVAFLGSWGIAAFYFTIKRRLRIGPRLDRIGKSSDK